MVVEWCPGFQWDGRESLAAATDQRFVMIESIILMDTRLRVKDWGYVTPALSTAVLSLFEVRPIGLTDYSNENKQTK